MKENVFLYIISFFIGVSIVVIGYVLYTLSIGTGTVEEVAIETIEEGLDLIQYQEGNEEWENAADAFVQAQEGIDTYSVEASKARLEELSVYARLDKERALQGYLDIVNDDQYAEQFRLEALFDYVQVLNIMLLYEFADLGYAFSKIENITEGGYYAPTGDVVIPDGRDESAYRFRESDVYLFASKRALDVGRGFDSLRYLTNHLLVYPYNSSNVGYVKDTLSFVQQELPQYDNPPAIRVFLSYLSVYYISNYLFLGNLETFVETQEAFDDLLRYADLMNEEAQQNGVDKNRFVVSPLYLSSLYNLTSYFFEYGIALKERQEDVKLIGEVLNEYIYRAGEAANPSPVFVRNLSHFRDDADSTFYKRMYYVALSYYATYVDSQLKNFLINDVGIVDGVGWREDDFGYSEEQYEQWLEAWKEL